MNGRRIVQLFLAALVIVVVAVVTVHLIKAQTNPPALVVHPSNVQVDLTPGKTTSGTIFLKNTTEKTVTIASSLKNFTAQGEEGAVDLTTDNTPFSLSTWMKVTPTKVDVPAGKEVAFDYTITPPSNAEPGGHFGSVVFSTVPSSVSNTGSAISQEVAALILATVPGNAKEDAVLESITTDKSFYEFGPVTFTLRVKNNGDIHVQPFGAVEVVDMLGHKVDAPINPTNVLPNAVRRITAVLSNQLLIGKYTAVVVASYGSKNQPLTGSVEFWAFPVRYALVALAVLLVLLFIRKRLFKAFKAIVTGK